MRNEHPATQNEGAANLILRMALRKSIEMFGSSLYCAELFDSGGFLHRMGSMPETHNPGIAWTLATRKGATNAASVTDRRSWL